MKYPQQKSVVSDCSATSCRILPALGSNRSSSQVTWSSRRSPRSERPTLESRSHMPLGQGRKVLPLVREGGRAWPLRCVRWGDRPVARVIVSGSRPAPITRNATRFASGLSPPNARDLSSDGFGGCSDIVQYIDRQAALREAAAHLGRSRSRSSSELLTAF